MKPSPTVPSGRYLSAIDPANESDLLDLQRRMLDYYRNSQYHDEWVRGCNADWQIGMHHAQIEMCKNIPPGSCILEVGCGDGRGSEEIKERVKNVEYIGIDLNSDLWAGKQGFVAAKAHRIPFCSSSFEIVLSMFVIEHLVFPAHFLTEAWRVLRPGGRFVVIAPDFATKAMRSERIGFTYGSGREKLAQGQFIDALLTSYDSRVRIFLKRLRRQRELHKGKFSFPVYTEPRCLYLPGFRPDCDAVYPVCPEEIISFFQEQDDYQQSEIFHRDRSVFGILVLKL